jgi:hypothetical protein
LDADRQETLAFTNACQPDTLWCSPKLGVTALLLVNLDTTLNGSKLCAEGGVNEASIFSFFDVGVPSFKILFIYFGVDLIFT